MKNTGILRICAGTTFNYYCNYSLFSALEVSLSDMRYMNSRFTYLLTFLNRAARMRWVMMNYWS